MKITSFEKFKKNHIKSNLTSKIVGGRDCETAGGTKRSDTCSSCYVKYTSDFIVSSTRIDYYGVKDADIL